MFKKFLITSVIFALSTSNAFCAVPIFGSTDSSQQLDLAPVSSSVTATGNKTEAGIKVQNDFTQFGQIRDDNFRNAIQNLDGAQVGIREQLAEYKFQYTGSKARYDAAKAECNALRKEIRSFEKQLKDIDRAKKKIEKNISG